MQAVFLCLKIMERRIRGVRMIKRRDERKASLMLMLQNDRLYVVVMRISFLGLIYKKRRFEFNNLGDAEYFFDRVSFKLFRPALSNQFNGLL